MNISKRIFTDALKFSLKVEVMGLKPGYLLKSFLLYIVNKFGACNAGWCNARRLTPMCAHRSWKSEFSVFLSSVCAVNLFDIGDKWHNPEKNKKLSCSHLILKVKTCYFQTKCMVKRMKWIIWQLVQSRKFLNKFYVKEKKNRGNFEMSFWCHQFSQKTNKTILLEVS